MPQTPTEVRGCLLHLNMSYRLHDTSVDGSDGRHVKEQEVCKYVVGTTLQVAYTVAKPTKLLFEAFSLVVRNYCLKHSY